MSSAQKPLLLILLGALVAVVGASAAVWLLGRGEPEGGHELPQLLPGAPAGPVAPDPGERLSTGPAEPEPTPEPAGPPAYSTVLWPLEVELELLRSELLPEIEGGDPIGSGATARLAGRIVDHRGEGVLASVAFAAGPNQGRVLHCDSGGRFGASDLLPGLDVVTVQGPGILGSRREVRLRGGTEALLNIGYGRPATVYGTVLDPEGEPVQGARVSVDGQPAVTDFEGQFYIQAVASGKGLLEIESPEFTTLRSEINVTAGTTYMPGRLEFRLQRPAQIQLSLPDSVGGPGPAQVFVLPSNTDVQRNFPWYRLNPLEVMPGSTLLIEGLPARMVHLRVFREGAVASPRTRAVNLRAGVTHPVEIRLEPADKLIGTVVRNGSPVAGASVRLEAPNRVDATLAFYRKPRYFLETEVMPPIPPAVQEVSTDRLGRFALTAWSDVSPTRYLEARGPEGKTWAARLVGPEDVELVLELQELPSADAELLFHIPRRHQGLPVEVTVKGSPREPFTLPSHESLRVGGLEPGTWRIQAEWYVDPVLLPVVIDVRGTTEMGLELPQEAIDGQDRDRWRRAGREYPEPEFDR